jgi:hypothetical protein
MLLATSAPFPSSPLPSLPDYRRAEAPRKGMDLRAVSEYFHRVKEEGLFVAIVLVPSRSSHEPNYSHQDPDEPASYEQVGRCLGGSHFFT